MVVDTDPDEDGPGASSPARALLRRLLDSRFGEAGVEWATRQELLDRLCDLAVSELGASGATVTLLPTTRAHAVVGASGKAARTWEQAQFDVGEGPTSEADLRQVPVLVGDLRAEAHRWPGLANDGRYAEVAAVFAVPLRLGASRFGTLTVYRDLVGPIGADGLMTLHVLGDIVVELLIDTHPHDEQGTAGDDRVDLATVLNDELDGHAVVFQAQGMVMVQLGCSLAEALARMRARAYAEALTLSALSHHIVDGTTTFTKGT